MDIQDIIAHSPQSENIQRTLADFAITFRK